MNSAIWLSAGLKKMAELKNAVQCESSHFPQPSSSWPLGSFKAARLSTTRSRPSPASCPLWCGSSCFFWTGSIWIKKCCCVLLSEECAPWHDVLMIFPCSAHNEMPSSQSKKNLHSLQIVRFPSTACCTLHCSNRRMNRIIRLRLGLGDSYFILSLFLIPVVVVSYNHNQINFWRLIHTHHNA